MGSCHFIQRSVHLVTSHAGNTTCKVSLIFNVTINYLENKFSPVEKQQQGQEVNAGGCSAWGAVATGWASLAMALVGHVFQDLMLVFL